jgi:anti-anti-sigma factor
MSRARIEYHGGTPVVRPRGDIDASNVVGLRRDLSDCVEQRFDELVLDLTATGYVDSAGIDMVLRLHDRLRERRTVLRVVIAPGSQLDRLSDVVGLGAAVAVYHSLDEALEARSQPAA